MPNLASSSDGGVAADPALPPDKRPRSAVSAGVGIVGLAGLVAYLLLARYAPQIAAFLSVDWGDRGRMDGPNSAIASVLACGIPMVLWSVFVDKVHRNPSTGIDWSLRRPWRETIDISLTKLAGLWATWALIALIYATMRFIGRAITPFRWTCSNASRRAARSYRCPMCCGSTGAWSSRATVAAPSAAG